MWWPGIFGNPALPYFAGARTVAANVPQPGERGDYTVEMFQADFPQFFTAEGTSLAPASILQMLVDQANDSILPSRWGSLWRYAAGLYVAHYLTLYLRTYAPSSDSPEQAAASGTLVGIAKSATLGDASVSYDTAALMAGTEDWGDLNATQYGQILASKARFIGMGGMVVI